MSVVFTAETRVNVTSKDLNFLINYISYYNKVKHKLFVELVYKNKSIKQLKKEFILTYKITARQFNSIRIELEGKIRSIKTNQKNRVILLKDNIKSIKKWIKFNLKKVEKQKENKIKQEKCKLSNQVKCKLSNPAKNSDKKSLKFNLESQIHHKKRRLFMLIKKLEKLILNMSKNKVQICFGGRSHFHKQFNLFENNYLNHNEWKKDWLLRRASTLFLVGSKDENAGNQSCTIIDNKLRLRVPPYLEDLFGKYYFLNISYGYGQQEINQAMDNKQAISHRFKLKDNKLYLHSSFDYKKEQIKSISKIGAIGLDLNINHIAYCEIDSNGNKIDTRSFNTDVTDKTHNQIKAIYADQIQKIVTLAKEKQKPIICEKLDFHKKKSTLREQNKKYSRMLSNFSYSYFRKALERKCNIEGVLLIAVNPAYTSIIGQVKYMGRYGITSHQSAALVIARRGLGVRKEKIPTRNACGELVKISHQHGWYSWNKILKEFKLNKLYKREFLYNWRPLQGFTGLSIKQFQTFGEILSYTKICET